MTDLKQTLKEFHIGASSGQSLPWYRIQRAYNRTLGRKVVPPAGFSWGMYLRSVVVRKPGIHLAFCIDKIQSLRWSPVVYDGPCMYLDPEKPPCAVEIIEWIEDNLRGLWWDAYGYYLEDVIYFELEEDAIAFAVKYGRERE